MNSYIKAREKAIHEASKKLTLAQEREVVQAYVDAGKRLIKKIETSNGFVTDQVYRQYAQQLYTQLNAIQRDYATAAARSPMTEELKVTLRMLSEGGVDNAEWKSKVSKAADIYSRRAVENLIRGGIYKDGVGMSARIWKHARNASQSVQRIVAEGLASGMSAMDMAKLLEQYVEPSSRKYWNYEKIKEKLGAANASTFKNLEYNSLRLARTTISHAATSAMRECKNLNPFFKKLQWHSVHAPGRTCQICIDMDGNIYPVDECPFDHPNGLCYQTHYFEESMDEMADRLRNWTDNPDSDSELEDWWQQMNRDIMNNK